MGKESTENKAIELENGTGFLHASTVTGKEKEGSPNYFGTVKINDETFEIGGWKKEGKSGRDHIQISVRPSNISIEEWAKSAKDFKKSYQEEQKKNEDVYILYPYCGNLHKTEETDKDFFGSVRIDNDIVNLNGHLFSKSDKNGVMRTIVRLEVSKGMSKEQRNKLAENF